MADSAADEMQSVSNTLRRQIWDANQPPWTEPKRGATIVPFPVKRQRRFIGKAFSESYHMTEKQAFAHFCKRAADYVERLLALGVERHRVDAELRDLLATINATFTKELTVEAVGACRCRLGTAIERNIDDKGETKHYRSVS
jgi:hypothetical protein